MAEGTASEAIELHEHSAKRPENVDSEGNAIGSQQQVDAVAPMTKADLIRVFTAGYAFFCAGVNDGSLGPIIPYLLRSYNIGTNFVSIV